LPETGTSQGGEVTLVLNGQCTMVRTNVLYQSAKAELEWGHHGQGRLGKIYVKRQTPTDNWQL